MKKAEKKRSPPVLSDDLIENMVSKGGVIIAMGGNPDNVYLALDVRMLRRSVDSLITIIDHLEKKIPRGVLEKPMRLALKNVRKNWAQYRKDTASRPKKARRG